MILFIDAYNLLRQLLSAAEIDQGAHKAIERELGSFAGTHGHTAFMVYDGPSYATHVATEGRGSRFVIMHSGNQTADDVIKRHIVEYPVEKTLIISQDRELCAYVARRGYHSIDPLDFYHYVKNSGQKGTVARKLQGPLVKLSAEQDSGIDALMHEASLQPFYKEVHDNTGDYGTSKKSKKEKKMHRIIKPL